MNDFIQAYLNLLIYQYRGKPKASAEISTIVKEFGSIYELYNSFETEFNLDTARGAQLDIIGRIVGLLRTVPELAPRDYFGFDGDDTTHPYDELFDRIVTYPFRELGSAEYADYQLEDNEYRGFLKAKISKNFLKSDIVSMNEIVMFLFNDLAEVVDNKDMTLDLYIDATIDPSLVRTIKQLDLLPKPQGVRYNNTITKYFDKETFGFEDDLDAAGFSEFDGSIQGGRFAELLF